MPTKPPDKHRSQFPSTSDAWDALTGSHSLKSDPPGVQWIQRRVGWVVLLVARHWITTHAAFGVASAFAWHLLCRRFGWMR